MTPLPAVPCAARRLGAQQARGGDRQTPPGEPIHRCGCDTPPAPPPPLCRFKEGGGYRPPVGVGAHSDERQANVNVAAAAVSEGGGAELQRGVVADFCGQGP